MAGIYPVFITPGVIFLCITGMVLADVFDARFGVVPFSAPRLRLVAELKLSCRCTAFVVFFRGTLCRVHFACGAFRAQVACGSLYRG